MIGRIVDYLGIIQEAAILDICYDRQEEVQTITCHINGCHGVAVLVSMVCLERYLLASLNIMQLYNIMFCLRYVILFCMKKYVCNRYSDATKQFGNSYG
jgi:hypothetical protein